MNKKGQSLSMNTIILGILVIIVLVIVVVFFMGGFGTITSKIRSILGFTTSGTELNVALQQCETRCQLAQSMPDNIEHTSAYCTSPFLIDYNPEDNKADTIELDGTSLEIEYYCDEDSAGLRFDQGKELRLHLGYNCPGVVC